MQSQQLLDILARLRADGLQHCAVLADDDALVRVTFAVNRRVDFWVMANRSFLTKWSNVLQPEGFPVALWTPSALLRLFLDLY